MVIKLNRFIIYFVLICFLGLLLFFPKKMAVKDVDRIILKPENDSYDLNHDYEIMKNRVATSFKDANLIKKEDSFVLEIKPSDMSTEALSEYIEFFICESNDTYLADTSIDFFQPNYKCVTTLEPSDIDEFSLVDLDDSTRQLLMRFDERIDVLVEKNDIEELSIMREDSSEAYTTNMRLEEKIVLEKEDDSHYSITYPKSDDLYGKEESFMYSLMNDRLSTSYNYYIEKEIPWQKAGNTASSDIGINQVNQLEGDDLYTFTFQHQGGRSTIDELSYVNDRINARLDCLDTPYMYGVDVYGNVSIKIPKKHIGNLVLSSFEMGDVFVLKVGSRIVYIPQDIMEINEEDQSFDLFVAKEVKSDLDEYVSKSNNNRVYFVFNDRPIAYLDYNPEEVESKLHFDHFCYKEDESVDEWFFDYLDEIYNSENENKIYYKLSSVIYNETGYGDTSHYGLKESYLLNTDSIKQEIESIYDCVEIESSDGNLYAVFNRELAPHEMVAVIENITRYVESQDVFVNGIEFLCAPHERIEISMNEHHISMTCYLLDMNKKDFNRELVENLKQNPFFRSIIDEEYNSFQLNGGIDDYINAFWQVIQ